MDEEARYRWIATHVLPYEGEVRAWLRRSSHTLRGTDIDDVLQEAYARLWVADFARIVNGRGYFYTTVRNVLLEHARRSRIVPMERLGEIESLRIMSEEPGPERQASARLEVERLWRVIAELPQQCRRAFQLQSFEDRSRREIAERMGISERTVEKHLAKALQRVAAAMAEDPAAPARTDEMHRAVKHDGK